MTSFLINETALPQSVYEGLELMCNTVARELSLALKRQTGQQPVTTLLITKTTETYHAAVVVVYCFLAQQYS